MENPNNEVGQEVQNIEINPSERLQTEQSELGQVYSSFSKQEFDKWLFLAFTYLITFFLLLLWQQGHLPLEISLIPSIFADFFIVLKSSLLLKSRREDYEKRLIYKEIIENVGTSSTKIIILVYLINPCFPLTYSLIPLSGSTLANIMIKSISFNRCQIFSEIMFIMMRIVRLLSCTSIFFRVDGFYDFDWSLAFWPIWSFISIIGIVTLGLLLFSINLYSNPSSLNKLPILGSFYLVLSLTLFMVSFTIFFISLSTKSPNFYAPFIFLICFVSLSFIIKKLLQSAVIEFLTFEPDSRVIQIVPASTQRRVQFNNSFISSVLSNPPKFMVKLSSSYFKQAPDYFRPAKKRTSSVAISPSEQLFHRRSITSEQFAKRKKEHSDTNIASLDAEKCLTCMEKISNAVLMNCGHGGICYECATKLLQEVGVCHICRAKIEIVVRVFQYPGGVHEVITESEQV